MCLGLGVVGLDVDFDKIFCGVVGGLRKDKLITVENVIEMIKSVVESDSDDVDNVCRLYIFVCFVVLYFPTNSKTISNDEERRKRWMKEKGVLVEEEG